MSPLRPSPNLRRRSHLFVLLLPLCLLLASCMSRPDSLAPIISITNPKSGATRSSDVLRIYGYALDDEGVAAIRVNGTDLLQFEANRPARGKSLVQFAFQGNPDREGDVDFVIEVEDTTGRVTVLTYTLTIDTTPPTLELESQALGSSRYRIRGVASDNTEVSAIRLGGLPLQFRPAAEYAFEFDNILLEEPVVEVVDSAGNRIERRIQ